MPDQNAELLRLQSGATDLTHSELRSDDYIPVRRAEEAGTLTMVELGVGPDADAFWFCLKPEKKGRDPRFAFVSRREFRQAISHAVDREEFARTVFLGEAVPIWGPVTPGNRLWFSPNVPRYPFDRARARDLLESIGLEDRNGNGVVEDKAGTEARFTVITQQGLGYYERGTTVLREYAAAVGIALDIVPLEFSAMVARLLACDYDAIYMRPLATDLDPAGNLDYWLSSGSAHLWNMQQESPATEWEKHIDTLMREQATTPRSRAPAGDLRGGAEGVGRERAGALLRLAASLLRTQQTRSRCGAVDHAPTGAVERRLVQRREHSLMAHFLVRRLLFAIVLIAMTSSAALLLARLAPGDMTSQLGPFASSVDVENTRTRFNLDREPAVTVVAVGEPCRFGSTSETRFSTTARWRRWWRAPRGIRRCSGSSRS